MPKLEWDKIGERLYETGVDRGVLFVYDKSEKEYKTGVPWNGLIAVSENPTGAEPNPQYADNIKYLNLMSAEEFEASIEAFMYPPEFAECDGSASPVDGLEVSQQNRSLFGFAYRTLMGSDAEGTDYGYKLHIIYGALATPTDKSYTTQSDSPEALTFNWDITTTPVPVTRFKPTACVIIESVDAEVDGLAELEDILYGVDADVENGIVASDSRLPMPDEILTIMATTQG
ncbi:MAG: hypothetical protein GX813_03030 [Erysipelotrichia bacterium]|nr:hypothetical protein [Erysipelotrichia bacterium]